MLKKLFSGQISNITIAALLVALSSLVSRLLGIFRDRILAGEFGAGDTLDIYYAAFRVPDLIFNLLVLGALSAGFVPILTGLIKHDDEKNSHEAWSLVNSIMNAMIVLLLVLSVVGIVFSGPLTDLIAPGFTGEARSLTAALTRIMFLSPLFLGISSVFGGVLQSFKRFFVYSLSPIMYNVGIIVGALYLVPIWGVYGLAYGVVLGTFLHMLIQLPLVMKLGYRYKITWDLANHNFRKIAKMMVPRTMSLAITQINLVIITIIASTLASGSLSIFNFANNLQSFPIGIFGISFAVAAFPTLSAVAFDKKKLKDNFSMVMRHILFFIVPATVLLLTLRAQLIRVILGTGMFDWEDTFLTLHTLSFFAISLFAQAGAPLLVRMFYARHNSQTPFYVGLFSIAANIILSFALPNMKICLNVVAGGANEAICQPMGVMGLALAFSISSIINFILLWLFLRMEIGSMDENRILVSALKLTTAAIAGGIAVQGVKLLVWPFVDMTKVWGVFTQGVLAGLAGIAIYLAFCSLFKSEEYRYFWGAFKRRLPWKKVTVNDQGEARGV